MDDIDFRILKMLSENGRVSYEIIAKSVGLTGNAVRKRVQSMIDKGVIERFYSCINPTVFGYLVFIAIFEYNKELEEDAFNELKELDNVMYVVNSINEISAVVFLFKDEENRKQMIDSISATIKSAKLVLTFVYPKHIPDIKIRKIDWRIIRSLKDNLRKPICDIAGELNISTKTVKRHLDNLIDNEDVYCTTLVQPRMIEGIIPYYLAIEFGEDINIGKTILSFRERFDNYWFKQKIQNSPILIMQLYGHTLKEIEDNIRFLQNREDVKNLIVFYPSKIYYSDKYVEEGLKSRTTAEY